MKCRKCDQKAAFNMRHHKLALCRDHYLEWFVDRTPGKRNQCPYILLVSPPDSTQEHP